MLCRISLLLGRPPSEVEALPVTDLTLLAAYWADEPWGPWRDNVHAAIVAAAVINSSNPPPKRPVNYTRFMLRPRKAGQAENRGSLLSALRLMARRKPRD